jgi:hypothetical protein
MTLRFSTLVLGLALLAAPSVAQNLAHLRTDCTGYSNCFTNMDALSSWLWGTRVPTFTDPVAVIVGVGDFGGRLACVYNEVPGDMGFVTLRGESRTGSRLVGTDTNPFHYGAVYANNCDELDFQNLTIVASNIDIGMGVYWEGDGDSRWIDVDIEAPYVAWYDAGCPGATTDPPTGLHYFQGSTLSAGAAGWFAGCGEALIYETQISVLPGNSTSMIQSNNAFGVVADYRAELYLLETDVTVDATQRSTPTITTGVDAGSFVGSLPAGSGEVEMFGGTLTVKGNADDTLHGGRARKFSETAVPAAVRIQGTKLVLQNGTAPANVTSGNGELERVDLAH